MGKKAQPSFRIIVQDKRSSPKNKALDILGYYQPARTPKVFKIDEERAKKWIKNGAHPSDSLASILKKNGFDNMDKFMAPRDKKHKKKGEEAAAPAAPAAAPAAAA